MRKLLSLVLCLAVIAGCEDKEKKECDCAPEAGQMMEAEMDGGQDGGQEEMGLDAGQEEDQGGEDAGAEESDGEAGDQDVSDCDACPDEEPCDC